MQWIPFAVGWAAVSAAGLLWPVLPSWPPVAFWCAAGVLVSAALATAWALAGARRAAASGAWRAAVAVALSLLFMAAGAAAGLAVFIATGQAALSHRWPVTRETEFVTFSGCVVGVPQIGPGRIRFELAGLQGAAPARLVRLNWYRARRVPQGGERWEVTARLRAPRGLVNPGPGDYSLALLQAGVDASGTVREAHRVAGDECLQGMAGWRQRVDSVRAMLGARLSTAVGAPGEAVSSTSPLAAKGSGLLLALALGLQNEVSDAQWRVFSVTGISHLVAISGLHVTLFAWLVLVFVRFVKGRGRLAPAAGLGEGAAVLAVAAALGYALLAGGNLPALRTVWMLALGMAVRALRRHGAFADAWAAALVAALWLDPFAGASLGFWLSFGAVGALIWSTSGSLAVATRIAAGTSNAAAATRKQAFRAAAGAFLVEQGVVTLVLAPLLASSVGFPAWVSLPVNAVAIPLFSAVLVPAVLLATLGVAMAPLATAWWVHGVAVVLGACVAALEWCAGLPGVHWSPAGPSWWFAGVAVAFALAACTPLLPRRSRAGAALGCAAVLLWPGARPPAGGFSLVVLDVGQGSAAVVETARHAVVFDPGPAYGPDADAGGRVVVPVLRAAGWHRLNAVVVSHADADHAAGLGQVLQHFPETSVWWGGDAGAAGHGRQPCRAGLQWMLDGVSFRFLHPAAVPERDDNSGSCVLLVQAAGRTALLLADIPEHIEDQLVAAGPLPADIVLVAHHGSATASGEALRRATRVAARRTLPVDTGVGEPGYAAVSAGYRNRWGFPKAAVRTGWQEVGKRLWVTAEGGALLFRVNPDGSLSASALRREQPRWWRPPNPPPAVQPEGSS